VIKKTLEELETSFKFNDAVLRHLTFATKGAVASPSPMMKEEKSKTIVGDKEAVDTKEEETSESWMN